MQIQRRSAWHRPDFAVRSAINLSGVTLLRQKALRLAAGMNGLRGFAGFRKDAPRLAAGCFTICLSLLTMYGYADSTILIKANTPWSVTGKSDVQQIKHLASGVGFEFEPNAATTAELKKIGIKTIRCINVDPLPGRFDETGKFIIGEKEYTDRLLGHLNLCREIGASPHIIIATGLHPDLQVKAGDITDPVKKEQFMGNLGTSGVYGPNNWEKFQNYIEAYFEYVLIKQNFPDARFEVANEPDIGGSFAPSPPKPAMGSKALYEAYFDLYRNVATAARRFEKSHPGVTVRLGGPALAWAFTFKFGAFNWIERFLRDCGEQKVKLDFIGIHYYGNISSLNGEYPATYPSFSEMLKLTQTARDRYCPGVPMWLTEWGASYCADNSAPASVNANNVGAAWTAAFLNALLEDKIDGALYLVTTDLRQQTKDGGWEDVWGWPALFMNPALTGGKAIPKAPGHIFEMISRLEGERCESTRGAKSVNCLVSADKNKRRITAVVWNYGYRIPEGGVGTENAQRESVTVRVRDAAEFFGTGKVKVERWQVSETTSNAHYLFLKGDKIDDRANLQKVDSGSFAILDGQLDAGFAMPPSSVSFILFSAE